ncbi:MAG: hypothetical protein RLZZ422_2189 [Pseudomonadota bacterium]|jgi:N-acetylglutamate synthase-like GNAT family acetyltransferase
MLALSIRLAEPKDAEAMAELLTQLGYANLPKQLAQFLNQAMPQQVNLVGVLDKKIVAVMSLMYFDYLPSLERYCRITTLVVEEKLRGWGIGKQLIDYAQQYATHHHCQVLELTTGLQRTAAHQFYESLGFEQVSYKYTKRLTKAD